MYLFLKQVLSFVTCLTTANLSVPYGALATFGPSAKEAFEKAFTVPAAKPDKSTSHLLTAKERKGLYGSRGECPYTAGSAKWDITVEGVNVLTGNYSTSVTDMSFDGGYGIPVNVTRSYSVNDANEGPFGKGWELSADVRNTAGGILKSKGAPIRSVPNSFKLRHSRESDPNIATQPAEAITAVDASGKDETIQRDVDGIMTNQPWDNNVMNSVESWQQFGGSWYQVLTSNQETTPDGTVYQYQTEGSYPSGTLPWDANLMSPAPTAEPANVLKVTSVTDRQGNQTLYNYGSGWVTFNKIDGTTQEHPLTSVQMPNGHTITFTWGTGALANRVVSISDGTRTVNYGYTNINSQELLTSITTPGGKTTYYGYGSAITNTAVTGLTWYGDTAANLLTSITDPRGLVTSMSYVMASPSVLPYGSHVPEAVMCYQENNPNGTQLAILNPIYSNPNGEGIPNVLDRPGFKLTGSSTDEFMTAGINVSIGVSSPVVWTGIQSWYATYNNFSNDWCTTFYENTEYDATTQNQLQDNLWTYPKSAGWDFAKFRDIPVASWSDQYLQTSTTYNWLGNPLSKTVDEHEDEPDNSYIDHTYQTGCSYWDSSKYYQQKATLDEAGRYTYTDYYSNMAAAGSKGQKEYSYDSKNCAFELNTSVIPPSGTPASEYWRYQLQPINASDYSASMAYDAYGRSTDAYKLQSTTGDIYSYVQTHTVHGTSTDGSWGQANAVAEDYGGINRVTQIKNYTAWGKANDVIDAAGHEFSTTYDQDGNIQAVTRVDNGLNQNIATYTYGTVPGVSFGQLVSITDGLSGVADAVTYQSSGIGAGEVSQVSETGGSNPNYTVAYTFDALGQRSKTTYTTSNGTWRWLYEDYSQVGVPTKFRMAFRTMVLLDSSSNPTAEEMHYAYDSAGRLQSACFAQTPASGYNPGTGGDYYTSSEEASARCRAAYDYDPAGRTRSVNHWWETYQGSGNYSEEAVLGNTCEYELTGLNRGLKTKSDFYENTTQGSAAWTLNHSETFSYDSSLDYLTGANYADGLANQTPSWSYDAAGNRTDSVVDNLNRTTSIGGVSTTCDILGNRLTKGSSISYGWDCLNRMITYQDLSGLSTYSYRADGMRVGKSVGSPAINTAYCYDGQMSFEDTDISSSQTTVTDYGLGARGIDYIASNNGNMVVGFPIYDAHGNMVACLQRGGIGYYTLSNQRNFDAWGLVRQGNSNGDPKGRYCASIGHKQDDESGLIYMRARYYDTSSGRFVSEDPKMVGANFFSYCSNNPVNNIDPSGMDWEDRDQTACNWWVAIGSLLVFSGAAVCWFGRTSVKALGVAVALIAGSAAAYGAALADTPASFMDPTAKDIAAGVNMFIGIVVSIVVALAAEKFEPAFLFGASIAFVVEDTMILGALVDCQLTE